VQVAYHFLVVHQHVQIDTRHRDVGVARGRAHLGQRAASRQGMRDERVPAVVDGQRLDACHAEHLARRQKLAAHNILNSRWILLT
jgi:hypothetical protein